MKKKTAKSRSPSGRQLLACSVVYALTDLLLGFLNNTVYWQVLNMKISQGIFLSLSASYLLTVALIVGKNPVPAFRQRLVFLIFSGFLLVSVLQFPKYTYRQAADMVAAKENITAQPLELINGHYYAHIEEDPKNPGQTRLLYYDYIFVFDDGTERVFYFDPNTGEYALVTDETDREFLYYLK